MWRGVPEHSAWIRKYTFTIIIHEHVQDRHISVQGNCVRWVQVWQELVHRTCHTRPLMCRHTPGTAFKSLELDCLWILNHSKPIRSFVVQFAQTKSLETGFSHVCRPNIIFFGRSTVFETRSQAVARIHKTKPLPIIFKMYTAVYCLQHLWGYVMSSVT